MRTYTFDKVKNIFVLGDCHGEFKTFFHGIKNGLSVKSEDEDKPHPKELERQARKAAIEQAARNAGNVSLPFGRFGRHEDTAMAYARFDSLSLEDTFKRAKKMMAGIYSNSIFIVAGDCGLGFNKPKYYEDTFSKFNNILSYNNSYLIFVRGNHDDPSYFDGETINLSNIKAIPDYSVISANGTNILCVGGAISLDRTWRIKQEERINRFSSNTKKTIYWKDEAPIFNNDALEEVIKNVKIDCVISHTAPSFVNPETHNGFDEWTERDASLADDIKDERKVFDRIFETLRDNGMSPKYWAYGHFDLCYIEKRAGTIFRALGDGFNPISIVDDLACFTHNEENKKKKLKGKKLSFKSIYTGGFDNGGQGIQPAEGERLEYPIPEGRHAVAEEGEEELVDDEHFERDPLIAGEINNEENDAAFENEILNGDATNIGVVHQDDNIAFEQVQEPTASVMADRTARFREELNRIYGTNRVRIEPYTIANTTGIVDIVTQNREI